MKIKNFDRLDDLEATVAARITDNPDYRIPICVQRALQSPDPGNPATLERCIRRVDDPSWAERIKDFVRRIRGIGGYTNKEFKSAFSKARQTEDENAEKAAQALSRLRGTELTNLEEIQDQFKKDNSTRRTNLRIGSKTMNHKVTTEEFEQHLTTLNRGNALNPLLLENIYLLCQQGPIAAVCENVHSFYKGAMVAMEKEQNPKAPNPLKITVVKHIDGRWTVSNSKLMNLFNPNDSTIEGEIESRTEMRFAADGKPLRSTSSFPRIFPKQPLPYQISSMLPE